MKPMLQYHRSHGAWPNLAARQGDRWRTELQIVQCVLRYKETEMSFRYITVHQLNIQVKHKFELEKKTYLHSKEHIFHSPPKESIFET